jgi:hypothetical protein
MTEPVIIPTDASSAKMTSLGIRPRGPPPLAWRTLRKGCKSRSTGSGPIRATWGRAVGRSADVIR